METLLFLVNTMFQQQITQTPNTQTHRPQTSRKSFKEKKASNCPKIRHIPCHVRLLSLRQVVIHTSNPYAGRDVLAPEP